MRNVGIFFGDERFTEPLTVCPFGCSKGFASNLQLRMHISKAHPAPSPPPFQLKGSLKKSHRAPKKISAKALKAQLDQKLKSTAIEPETKKRIPEVLQEIEVPKKKKPKLGDSIKLQVSAPFPSLQLTNPLS